MVASAIASYGSVNTTLLDMRENIYISGMRIVRYKLVVTTKIGDVASRH